MQPERCFWILLSRSWRSWEDTLLIVKPDTVIRWHRKRFASYWTQLSRQNPPRRPKKDREIRDLIRKMADANPLWGAPMVHGELLKLGIAISERTVSRWMPRRRKPPSQTWKALLRNHLAELVSIDFFAVPTATFRVLFVLLILAHDRRKILHFNVTEHPSYLIRDRDGIYGVTFQDQLKVLEIQEVVIAPRSPWQSPYVERVIGTLRRQCLDHVAILGETHLRRIIRK